MKKVFVLTALLLSVVVASANPTNMYSEIRKQIEMKYKGAVVLKIDDDNGKFEVEIIHQGNEKDAIFNNLGVWQSTKYDIKKSELPKKIKNVVENSVYSSYRIEEVEVIETPTQSLYEIDLDKWFKDEDVTVYITFDGEIL